MHCFANFYKVKELIKQKSYFINKLLILNHKKSKDEFMLNNKNQI